MGKSRTEIMPEVRSFPVRSHIIFYEVNADAVIILAIIHASQDPQDLFWLPLL